VSAHRINLKISFTFFGSPKSVYLSSLSVPLSILIIINYLTLINVIKKAAAIICRNALRLTDLDIDRENLRNVKEKRVTGTYEWIKNNNIY
jgi:hypothetical protein